VNTGPLFASEWGQALAFTKRNFVIPSVKLLADIELSSLQVEDESGEKV